MCNGESTECPDGVAPAGTECRAISGACDVVEKCGGLTKACPEDAFKASGTTCRDPAGVCDAAEKCTGLSGECPADAKLPTGTVCRKAADLVCRRGRAWLWLHLVGGQRRAMQPARRPLIFLPLSAVRPG